MTLVHLFLLLSIKPLTAISVLSNNRLITLPAMSAPNMYTHIRTFDKVEKRTPVAGLGDDNQ